MKKPILVIMSLVMISAFSVCPTAMSQETPIGAVETPLIYGTIGLVVDLDPHYAWDRASIDHINQVVEGLFAYNLGSSDGGIIPRLAAGCGTWNENATEFTVLLRENVTFHDGTAFNATAVKWNFDRLTAFIEAGDTQIAELYEPLADVYPATPLVINETVEVGTYEVKFILNYPFAALVPLLCFSGSVMISPASVPNSSVFLDAETDLLVGTGPFVHVNTTAEKTIFEAYSDYYRGTPAVQHMEWVHYEDTIITSNAMLAGEIDLGDVNTDFLDDFEASENITVGQLMKSTVILYLGMNNKLISKPIRQAINYAIDYDTMICDLRGGNAARMTSPIPEGIAYHNPDVQPATYNVTKARQILIDAGMSQGLTADSPDQDWLDMTDDDPTAAYHYRYNYGNVFREDFGIMLKANCKAIGIKIYLGSIGLYYLDLLLNDFNKLELYMIGWRPDYNDPSNYINPLFSNTSLSNSAQVNDPWLQNALVEAMNDTNPTTRKVTYFAIQEYIVEDLMPWAFLYVPLSRNVIANTITNWNRNPIGQLDFFSISFHGEAAIITDSLMATSCGFEAPWDYYDPPECPETETPTKEPKPLDFDTVVLTFTLLSLAVVVSISVLQGMGRVYKRIKENSIKWRGSK